MKEKSKTILAKLKKPRYWVTILILLIIIGLGARKALGPKKAAYETQAVERTSVVQDVDATGNVKSAETVDLGFESGGKIMALNVKVGDRVKAGDELAHLSNADVAANLSSAQAKLAQVEAGARPEDIAVSAAGVESARTALANARISLIDKINDAYVKAHDAVTNDADKLFENPTTNPSFGVTVSSGGTTYSITADTATTLAIDNERRTVGGILDGWQALDNRSENDPSAAAATAAKDLDTIQSMLNDIAAVINAKQSESATTNSVYSGFQADVSGARTTVSTALTTLRTATQSFQSAEDAVTTAEKQQALKAAPATAEDVRIQQAAVDAAEAAYAKTVLRAPFDGLVTAVTPEVGQIVSPSSPVVSLIADEKLEVELFIPESDIAKVRVGDPGDVTFDAYGKDFVATTTVVSIDPAATVLEGVPTYRTVMSFSSPDERIKSGMTANVTIHGERLDNVLAVPQRAIITKDDQKFVEVPDGKTTKEVPVETGLRGSDGNIEIVSGLTEGEEIIPSPTSQD